VKSALESVPGVRKVEVEFEKKEATVTVDREKYRPDALVDALAKAGYEHSSVGEQKP
jgi:copper chaperone CopZ